MGFCYKCIIISFISLFNKQLFNYYIFKLIFLHLTQVSCRTKSVIKGFDQFIYQLDNYMLNNQVVYSVPVSKSRSNQTAIYRSPLSIHKLHQPPQNMNTMQQFWKQIAKQYSQNKSLEDFTYAQVNTMSSSIGTWLYSHNHKVVYLYSKNRWEWTATDIGCFRYGIVTVPLYDTLGKQAMEYTIGLTQGSVIFVSGETAKSLVNLKLENIKSISTIVLFDEIQTIQLKYSIQGVQIMCFKQLLKNPIVKQPTLKPEDHLTYCFTSGTTGKPKGVILTQSNFACKMYSTAPILNFNAQDIHLSFLPLAHMFERTIYLSVLFKGGNVKYYCGIVADLVKDFARVRPTVLTIVPRLLNTFYAGLRLFSHVDKNIAEKAFQQKRQLWLKGVKSENHKQVFARAVNLFGGRVKVMITGSAPVAAEVLDFFRIVLGCAIREGYGQTQTTAGAFLTAINDIKAGHVGGPNPNIQFKLTDVPELNYLSSHNPPTGQICLRGHTIFKGYYKDEKNTKQAIDEQGWLHTGDVGLIQQNGALRIIDRKKNIYKLSQGEYIAPQKIENVYMRCAYVAQVFVHGHSLQSYNVAIIFPNKQLVEKYAKQQGIDQKFEQLCENAKVNKFILDLLTQQGKKDGLFGFQIAKKIKLISKSFANYGILTNTMKMQRHIAKVEFQAIINKLYQNQQ